MASYCGKCGAEVTPDKQFCSSCGAPVYSGVAVAPVVQPVAPLVAPPVSSGPSAVKIILIIVAIFVGLGILAAGAFGFWAWRVAHAIRDTYHVSEGGKEATINIPGAGSITANSTETYSASELGTDIYPGAEVSKGGMRMTMPTGSMISAMYLTSDSKDQVVSYYKGRLGSQASVFDTADGAILSIGRGKQESVMVTVTAKPSQHEGKTQIAIVHTINNKPS